MFPRYNKKPNINKYADIYARCATIRVTYFPCWLSVTAKQFLRKRNALLQHAHSHTAERISLIEAILHVHCDIARANKAIERSMPKRVSHATMFSLVNSPASCKVSLAGDY